MCAGRKNKDSKQIAMLLALAVHNLLFAQSYKMLIGNAHHICEYVCFNLYVVCVQFELECKHKHMCLATFIRISFSPFLLPSNTGDQLIFHVLIPCEKFIFLQSEPFIVPTTSSNMLAPASMKFTFKPQVTIEQTPPFQVH